MSGGPGYIALSSVLFSPVPVCGDVSPHDANQLGGLRACPNSIACEEHVHAPGRGT